MIAAFYLVFRLNLSYFSFTFMIHLVYSLLNSFYPCVVFASTRILHSYLPCLLFSPKLFNFFLITGEHIRNWRSRYFMLFENGDLIGFKQKPDLGNYNDPLNKFTVRGCQVLKIDRPKPYTFMLRGLHWANVIERTFCTEVEAERNDWCKAIEHVARMIQAEDELNEDVEMFDIKAEDDMSSKLHITKRGSSSRGKKIVRKLKKILITYNLILILCLTLLHFA